jgi:hypothetical protein
MQFLSGRLDTYHSGRMGEYNHWGRVVTYKDTDFDPAETQSDIEFIDDGSQQQQQEQQQ